MDGLGLLESRFFCCALTSIAVRLFGGIYLFIYLSFEPKGSSGGCFSRGCSRPATWPCTFVINPKLFLTLKIVILLKWPFFSFFLWKTTGNLSIYLSLYICIYLSIYLSIHQSIYLTYLSIYRCKFTAKMKTTQFVNNINTRRAPFFACLFIVQSWKAFYKHI